MIRREKVSTDSNPIQLRLSVYLPLSKNFCIATAMPIPKVAIRIQPIVTFHITAECKISTFAIMMLAKKEDRATNIIIVM